MLSSELSQRFIFLFYRLKHTIIYTVIGVFSIVCEIIIQFFLINLNTNFTLATYIAVCFGIFIAFILNVKFNFNIPNKKLRLALIYFISISAFSFLMQNLISDYLLSWEWNYGQSRFFVSGILFLFIYLLHRKFSFSERREVGVAVYANGIENISKIKDVIDVFPDFIHVDIVDNTVTGITNEVHAYRLEAIRAHWRNIKIHTHIMSKKPSQWIPYVAKYSDVVFIHDDIEENIVDLRASIIESGSEFGLALHAKNDYDNLDELLIPEKHVLILTIENPGHSGQGMMPEAIHLINKVNKLSNRSEINLCIDGGINSMNLRNFESDQIVSGSHVLNAHNPKLQIMKLQTMNEYSN
jgi:pentose-5-phosphate-3-epimerase/putative flippase GtrA